MGVLLVRRPLNQGLDASQICLTPGGQAFSAVVHLRSELAQNHLELPKLAVDVVIRICQQTGRLRPGLLDDSSGALTGGLEHVGLLDQVVAFGPGGLHQAPCLFATGGDNSLTVRQEGVRMVKIDRQHGAHPLERVEDLGPVDQAGR